MGARAGFRHSLVKALGHQQCAAMLCPCCARLACFLPTCSFRESGLDLHAPIKPGVDPRTPAESALINPPVLKYMITDLGLKVGGCSAATSNGPRLGLEARCSIKQWLRLIFWAIQAWPTVALISITTLHQLQVNERLPHFKGTLLHTVACMWKQMPPGQPYFTSQVHACDE